MGFKKIEEVTQEFWENSVNEYNKELIEEFLSQEHLSKQTLKQYESGLKIFAKWVHDNAKNKDITDLKPRDALKYQNFLIKKGLSSSAIKFKRSAVSSLCGFIEVYYNDEHPTFRNIFTKAIPNVAKNAVKEKQPLSTKEIETLVSELEKMGEWQKVAWIRFVYSTGCRREESRQLLKEVIHYEKAKDKNGKDKNFYITHKIRAKGRGAQGKERKFAFDEKAMKAIKRWLEYRENSGVKDECDFVFARKMSDGYKQVSANAFNLWCKQFSEILGGRPVHPHLFRSSRATNSVVEEGKDIKAVQALLGHESSTTTEIYIVRDNDDDLDDLF
jgi:site-specific recombinase XerD